MDAVLASRAGFEDDPMIVLGALLRGAASPDLLRLQEAAIR
jgi:hypothetical protein